MKNAEVKEEYMEKIRKAVQKLNDLKYSLIYGSPTEEDKALIDMILEHFNSKKS